MGQPFNTPESSSTTIRTRFGELTITSTRGVELLDLEDAAIFAEYGEAVLGVMCPPELAPLVEQIQARRRAERLRDWRTPEFLAARLAEVRRQQEGF